MAGLWHCMLGRDLRRNNAACSALRQLPVTPSATHNQIGPFWYWFLGEWVCVHSRTLWVSPTNSPVRLGVFPAASTPTGFFSQRLLDFHTVHFSGSYGYFLFLNLLLSFFWLCKEAKYIYLCLHLDQKSVVIDIWFQKQWTASNLEERRHILENCLGPIKVTQLVMMKALMLKMIMNSLNITISWHVNEKVLFLSLYYFTYMWFLSVHGKLNYYIKCCFGHMIISSSSL